MKLYLIRHGETVDNVAGLYAGVRDSALTVHGVEQANRLGNYFAQNGVKISHIFASPLTRAFKTAEAIQIAQDVAGSKDSTTGLEIVKVDELMEQSFGFYEGKPFFARSDPKKTGKESHHEKHRNDPGFEDMETKEAMGRRADTFLDQHLLPLMQNSGDESMTVAVVSHGMLLSTLWRRMLLRLPKKSLTIAPEVMAARGEIVLEHLGGWSNTGYLELRLEKDVTSEKPGTRSSSPLRPLSTTKVRLEREASPTISKLGDEGVEASPRTASPVTTPVRLQSSPLSPPAKVVSPVSPVKAGSTASTTLTGWSTIILMVDSKAHLVGLKRQRGGIGRMGHDDSQKKLDSFFKKQRTG